ncbi:MAG: fumarylacetoacetate hydrolase family protein [Hyphomonadaceae bacterium]|nr:fumarylacetoacetate hydrolase family protein [Hyphomonadaceae bacterium]
MAVEFLSFRLLSPCNLITSNILNTLNILEVMIITGTIYAVALNNRDEYERRESSFLEPPYKSPPNSPVLYIKPRNCVAVSGARVEIPADIPSLTLAPSLALLFAGTPNQPSAMALALDICETHASVFRPAIREQCRDGFLPLGEFVEWDPDILTGVCEMNVHGSQARSFDFAGLRRTPDELISELSSYMTLSDGDVLLVGAMQVRTERLDAQLVLTAPGMTGLKVTLARGLAI